MKYKPTILNIASILLIVIDNYIYWAAYLKGERYEYGFIALILSVTTGLLGLLVDFVLQRKLKNYWIINGIGLVLLIVLIILYFNNLR